MSYAPGKERPIELPRRGSATLLRRETVGSTSSTMQLVCRCDASGRTFRDPERRGVRAKLPAVAWCVFCLCEHTLEPGEGTE